MIAERADDIDAARELPREVFTALADAGMFHIGIPRSLGGAELDLPTWALVMEELGKADASTAWAVNQGANFGTISARMPPEIARAIWIDTPRSVVSNSPSPTGKAVVVDGGYRVSAKQGFSTGCRHASWIAAHAQVIENGAVRQLNGKPEARYLFVPVAQAELLDTWRTRGMRGTGTHHFEVKDVFVPAERSVLAVGAPLIEPGPRYKIPFGLSFAPGDAMVALAVARSCLDVFGDMAGAKTPRFMPGLLREQAHTQFAVGQAEANVRSGRAFLVEALDELWDEVTSKGVASVDKRAVLRVAATHAIRLAAQAVDSLYNTAGATAIFEGNLMQRHFQDIHVITQHMQGRLQHYEMIGQYWLGMPVDETRF